MQSRLQFQLRSPQRRFEMLESRWLLAALVECDANVEARSDSEAMIVAEASSDDQRASLDPACQERADEAQNTESQTAQENSDGNESESRDAQSRGQNDNADRNVPADQTEAAVDALEDQADDAESSDDGRVFEDVDGDGEISLVDAIIALDHASLGGEGESGSVAEGESSSDVFVARLGQILNSAEQDANDVQPAAADELARTLALLRSGLVPADFQQRDASLQRREISDWQRPEATADMIQFEPDQIAVRYAVVKPIVSSQNQAELQDVQRSPVTSETLISDQAEAASAPSEDRLAIPSDKLTDKSEGNTSRSENADIAISIPSTDGSNRRQPTSQSELESPIATAAGNSGADEGLMAYLRSAEFGFAPVVAGLAYALTRSIDRQPAAEPDTSLNHIQRKTRRRLWAPSYDE